MNDIDYLNNTVWATIGPSTIHGVGVFAIRDIPEGTRITDHSVNNTRQVRVLRVRDTDFRRIRPEIQQLILDRMLFAADSNVFEFYSPNAEACLQSFMNHSDAPNSDGLTALRDIGEGEEITEDFRAVLEGLTPHPLVARHHQRWMR